MKTWIGIDVSKATLAVCLLPQQQLLACSNDPLGHAQLLGHLQGLDIGNVLLEATGGYERLVMGALAGAGLMVTRINPRRARAFATALGKTAKTDPIDAALLARMKYRRGDVTLPMDPSLLEIATMRLSRLASTFGRKASAMCSGAIVLTRNTSSKAA